MPQQLELLEPDDLKLRPSLGRTEPRFWVRRFVVWSEPGTKLREFTLRPGLNIIWSEDQASPASGEEHSLGHGSGKTLFCRLLRYCLGEPRFAPEGQREGIAIKLKDGVVGVDVLVDGTPWALVRPLSLRGRHMAVPYGDLDALAYGDGPATGLKPFLEAAESVVLPVDLTDLIPGTHPNRAWLSMLAWLSRDQECRFDHVLDWRSPMSGSDSPVRGFSKEQTLDALRALLGALDPAERARRAEIQSSTAKRDARIEDAERYAWQAKRLRTRIAKSLHVSEAKLPPHELALDPMRRAAVAALAKASAIEPATDADDIEALRRVRDDAYERFQTLRNRVASLSADLDGARRLVGQREAELAEAGFTTQMAESPACPVCEVPIDRVLADKCKLSHKLSNVDEVRARFARKQEALSEERKRVVVTQADLDETSRLLEVEREKASSLNERVRANERLRDTRADAWYEARRTLDDISRLAEAITEEAKARDVAEKLAAKIDRLREHLVDDRGGQAATIQRLSAVFNAITRRLVDRHARGKIALTGRGLALSIEMGGERTTAAIESLKVLAFDLAAMCLSIEGGSPSPAFLVHDSPREADLSLIAYHRLFEFAHSLEALGDAPLFQYILTTTTEPPAALRTEPWLRETLRGAPAEQRLLKRDL